MTQIRIIALALAMLFGTAAMLSAFGLHAGLLKGGDMLVDAINSRWSVEQVERFMLYVGPLSLILVAFGVTMMFWSTLRAKKQ
ncbi:hypothetical protein [Blastomonas sp. AAP53]|uniref:hypothetical protein n=1 Tax=Blastomonas sp. AAP53 TaxID=1248760 RepID=UPI000312A409|nr:hypothetical protein [Blastomonas sp. AAP53]